MRGAIAAGLIVSVLALTGCMSVADATRVEPTSSETPASERTEVDWENYSSEAKRLIDEDEAAKNCESLQGAFDVADNADDAQRDRTGDGNADLMRYIDEAMTAAGCYE